MTTWITEKEYRQSGGAFRTGLAINAAFLHEIKEDNVEFREVLQSTCLQFSGDDLPEPRVAADALGRLRDELETYFAVESFYGYFKNAEATHQAVSRKATILLDQHEHLFVQLNSLVDEAQQVVYGECGDNITISAIAERFKSFVQELQRHEQAERALIMRLINEDIGVGD